MSDRKPRRTGKPHVTRVTGGLPFGDLDDGAFERLCVELLTCEGFDRIEHLGATGDDEGIDLRARRGGRRLAFQCKRVAQFGPAPAAAAVAKILAFHQGAERPDEIVLVVSRDVSLDARRAAEQAGGDVPVIFWAGTELAARVNRYDRLRRDFFDLPPLPPGEGPLWTVPHPRNPHFTGREEILAELHKRLTSTGRAALSQAITGLGGVGKTQTAAEYCHRHRDAYRHVLWIDAESASTLADGYGILARRLGLAAETEADPAKIRGAVRDWLDRQDGWLLVLDNVDSVEDLRPYLPTGARGRVLITTRNSSLPGLGVERAVDLDVMAPGESVAFLLERTGAGELGREAAEKLAEELGHLPLALEQAAAYIAEVGVSFSAYLDSWKKRRLELLERQGPLEGLYRATVATTWAVSFARIEAVSPASADVLRIAAFLAPDAIPEELFAEAAGLLGPALATRAEELKDELALGELLAPLARISLIRRRPAERTFAVHRMVQEAVRNALGDARDEWLGRAVVGLDALASYEADSPSEWPRYRRIALHAQTLAGQLTGAEVDPAPAGRLLIQTAFFLWTQGRHAEARILEEQVLELHRRVLGEEHPNTLTSVNNLALTLRDQGDLAGARELHERSLSVCRRVLGEEHPDTLISMNNLGLTLAELGELPAGRDLLRQAVEGSRRVLGEEHPQTKLYAKNLADLEARLADLPPAPSPSP